MKILALSLAIGLPLCGQANGGQANGGAATAVTSTTAQPSSSTEAYSRVLNNPLRDPWQNPDAVVAAMNLTSSDTAAEIGTGAGYFARRMAKVAGKVYVIDSNPVVLNQARLEAPSNLTTILSTQNNFRIPANSIDKLIINNLLELSVDNLSYLAQLQSGLKPTAKIYLIDFFASESLKLPSSYDLNILTAVFNILGYRLLQNLSIFSQQDILVFGH